MTRAKAKATADGADETGALNANGEITLPLAGVDYRLRPSRKAISEIEEKLRPLPALVADIARGDLSVRDMGVIAASLMRAWGESNPNGENAVSHKGAGAEKLADLIYETGPPRIMARLALVLIGALNGGYTASGEAKPAATETA